MYITCVECLRRGEVVNQLGVNYNVVCLPCAVSFKKYDKRKRIGTGWYSF